MNDIYPIIIIGAGRSGTNMLRDILCANGRIATWPCDEINYIWRYGNAFHPNDVITPNLASDKSVKYIRKKFNEISKRYNCRYVLEKTCANSLRIPFVNKVFPDAKFIHIIRDGRDVACSAKERWTAKLDVLYLLKKAKYVPIKDFPYYSSRYLSSRFYKLFNKSSRLSTWGPRFEGINSIFKSYSVLQGSIIQWMECVMAAQGAFQSIEKSRVIEITYEKFVSNPEDQLNKIIEYFDLPLKVSEMNKPLQKVSSKSIGRWKRELSSDEICDLNKICGSLLNILGYV